MINRNDPFVPIAKIGAPHGVRGDLKLHAFTDDLQKITEYKEWFIEDHATWTPITMSLKVMHRSLLMHISGCDHREEAKGYVNKHLAIKRSAFTPMDDASSYYWADLEGLAVTTIEGRALGVIDHLFATGANDIMVVKGDKAHLVPFLDHVVVEVDLIHQTMTVDWDPDY